MVELNLNDIYKSIGGLIAEVQGLRRDMEASERRAGAENREADEKRAIMHRRLDEVISEVSDIKVDIATITGQVSESKAVSITTNLCYLKILSIPLRPPPVLRLAGFFSSQVGLHIPAFFVSTNKRKSRPASVM